MMMIDYIMILLSVSDQSVQGYLFGKYRKPEIPLFAEIKENVDTLTREQDNQELKDRIAEIHDKFNASLT
jgi:hypothetical protein